EVHGGATGPRLVPGSYGLGGDRADLLGPRLGYIGEALAVLAQDLLRQLGHVLTWVVVGASFDGPAERLLVAHPDAVEQVLHLGARVVVVVLPLHLPARFGEHSRQAVAKCRVACVADVQPSTGVAAHDFDLHVAAPGGVDRAVRSALAQDGIDLLAYPVVTQEEVDEARFRGLPTSQERRWILR